MDPIFVLGILQRSGTNFLHDLLCLHPDCVAPAPLWEDYLVHHADLLVRYTQLVSGHWNPKWGVEGLEDSLCRYLGNGVVSFLTSRIGQRRLVAKTPSVHNLQHFCKLFPQARLVILTRDGRAVVESGVRSFGWTYEEAMRKWADAARSLLEFEQANRNSACTYLIVKYEDLCRDAVGELRRIFAFLELDAKTYDFEAALNLPVKGSSALRERGKEAMHWKPVEKTSAFNPLLRWSHWNRARHERFNWIAGQSLVQLGYEEKRYARHRLVWQAWNRLLDLKWRVEQRLARRWPR